MLLENKPNYYVMSLNDDSGDNLKYYDICKNNNILAIGCGKVNSYSRHIKQIKVGDIIYIKDGLNNIKARAVVTKPYFYSEDKLEGKNSEEFNKYFFHRIGAKFEEMPSGKKLNTTKEFNLRLTRRTIYGPDDKYNFDKAFYIDDMNSNEEAYPYNRIIFGAPGTGKSYKLKDDIKKIN